MATRLFLNEAAADIAPTSKGLWNQTGASLTKKMATTKAGVSTNLSVTPLAANSAEGYRFVSPPIYTPVTLTGTFTYVIFTAIEDDAAGAATGFDLYGYMYVTQGESTTLVRGELYHTSSASTSLATSGMSFTAAGRAQSSARTLTSVSIQGGDRIVFEVGGFCIGSAGTMGIRRGGTDATDLTAGNTTTTRPGWIEFSQTFSFDSVSGKRRAWILE